MPRIDPWVSHLQYRNGIHTVAPRNATRSQPIAVAGRADNAMACHSRSIPTTPPATSNVIPSMLKRPGGIRSLSCQRGNERECLLVLEGVLMHIEPQAIRSASLPTVTLNLIDAHRSGTARVPAGPLPAFLHCHFANRGA
jgi:hypothetical protein